MTEPFSIHELRENIGNDAEIERQLLSVFVSSAEASLETLKNAFPKNQDEAYDRLWKTHMHQIKGAALNIGAATLQELAMQGQNAFQADQGVKAKLLLKVATGFNDVKHYIHTLYPLKNP